MCVCVCVCVCVGLPRVHFSKHTAAVTRSMPIITF